LGIKNKRLFLNGSNDISSNIGQEYDDYSDFNDYSPSYEKYGGAYGYDDDTIDTAFEGDPENYWNID